MDGLSLILSGCKFHSRTEDGIPRYTAQRQMYINYINVPINVTTEILLFGSPKVAPNQNVELFLAVQKFVIRSKRFTP
jgi:outer membrane lipopolysaccharide assembly protein LptE/RlpB